MQQSCEDGQQGPQESTKIVELREKLAESRNLRSKLCDLRLDKKALGIAEAQVQKLRHEVQRLDACIEQEHEEERKRKEHWDQVIAQTKSKEEKLESEFLELQRQAEVSNDSSISTLTDQEGESVSRKAYAVRPTVMMGELGLWLEEANTISELDKIKEAANRKVDEANEAIRSLRRDREEVMQEAKRQTKETEKYIHEKDELATEVAQLQQQIDALLKMVEGLHQVCADAQLPIVGCMSESFENFRCSDFHDDLLRWSPRSSDASEHISPQVNVWYDAGISPTASTSVGDSCRNIFGGTASSSLAPIPDVIEEDDAVAAEAEAAAELAELMKQQEA
eukprot:gnl/TRDRNA2_/TRDRNA2_83234_c0_seq1.p1 gnl/TRDRNA2_/TRDRNA2_83234_c0~~gnl/TRDRNA2_/TRDRNA2_83234_c0_seq1.p1  ORF type:complete len:337 (-),score=81.16 gnl/TRDRNA2_/TRDRNA2_83234_c0_seq1:239-1249(-)